jgi:aminoglycoside phosphotransferase (APT) family kinase protein
MCRAGVRRLPSLELTKVAPGLLPDRARAWAEALAPHRIVDVIAISGGITGTKWVLGLVVGDPLVIRWCDPRLWGAVGREHVRREALACRLLAGSGLPVPRLVGSDVDGVSAGGPANLMTWRSGRVRLERLGSAAITTLAGLAVAVHRQAVPVDLRPPTFSFRGPARPQVPDWAHRSGVWRRAIDVWAAGPPPTPYGLLHRDFHLSNVLWQEDTVTGLIDWAETSWGPPDLDVAHACSDFAMLHTTADAAAFRASYVAQGGRLDPDPNAARFWAVSDILGFLPDPAHILLALASSRPDLTPEAVRQRLEDLLVQSLE